MFGAPVTPAGASSSAFSFGATPATTAPASSASGGLFGNAAAPASSAGGGFSFGATPASAAPASAGGGLFGSAAPASSASGGLFGSAAPAASSASGGLFGSAAPAASSASGGLFGTPAAASASGGLLGASPALTPAATGGGGLFGASTPATGGGGLFGASAPAPALALGAAPASSASGGLFGAAPAASSASGGLFGAAPAASSASGGLFGAAPAASSASGGLFGSAPAPATPATTSGGLFGAAPTSTPATGGGLFGAASASTPATTSGGLFGAAPASTPATTGGGLFGAAPAASPGTTSGGLFGAAPAASPGTTSGGLFGSTPTASSAAGGLFGSAAPASSAGGLFGAAPSTGASASNPFGAPSTSTALVPASGGGLFGAAPTTPGAGAVTTQQQPSSLFAQAQQVPQVPSSLDPAREVQEIIDSYNPNHPDYKFRAFFYNVIKDPRLRVKPQNVSERKWRELLEAVGGENNPQHLWPVVYDGFEGLVRRKNEAETEMKAQEEFLAAVISATRQIMQWANTEVEQRMQKVKNKTMEQQHRLIKVFRALNQVQLKNYADANGGAIPPMSAEEIELLNAFKTLSARVNRSAASLPRRAEALAAASRLQRTIAPADEVEISDAEKQRFDAIIERQRAQIEELERKIDEKVAARKAAARISDATRPTSPATSAAHAQRSPTSLLFTESTLRK